jgi:hypothetical protein
MKNNSCNDSNKELEQEIKKATEDIHALISSAESRFSSANEEHDRNSAEWEKATKELKEKLEKIVKPFSEKSDALWKEMEYCKNQISKLNGSLEVTELILCYKFYQRKGIELDCKALSGMLLDVGVIKNTWLYRRARKIKKKLPNGLALFRYDDGEYVIYLATLGAELIAVHRTRKSEHIGDHADYEHYIGQDSICNRNYECWKYSFREWKKYLELYGDRIGTLKPLNLSDETVKKILERWYL